MADTTATDETSDNTGGNHSSGDGNPESREVEKIRDLKSVLVTSVLNLEELDVNLYRYVLILRRYLVQVC